MRETQPESPNFHEDLLAEVSKVLKPGREYTALERFFLGRMARATHLLTQGGGSQTKDQYKLISKFYSSTYTDCRALNIDGEARQIYINAKGKNTNQT